MISAALLVSPAISQIIQIIHTYKIHTMKTAKKFFSVTEFFNGQLEDFHNFEDAREAYEVTEGYLEVMTQALDDANESYNIERAMTPSGEFHTSVLISGGLYEFEGFINTNLTH